MNKELLAQAHKALKGDLRNTVTPTSADRFVYYCASFDDYMCLNKKTREHDYQYICTVEEFNNYKEDNMKTVRDAVIEFKVEWPVIRFTTDNWFENTDRLLYCEELVCTSKEFNTYVDSLSNHDTAELYQLYLAADKTTLIKETKVDYTSKQFWKDAPEWATDYATPKGMANKTKYWIGDNNYQSLNINGVKNTYGKEYIWTRDSFEVLATRPQPKPVYTQEMSDTAEHKGNIYQIDGLYIGSCNSLIQLKEIVDGEFKGIDSSGNLYQDDWLISIGQSNVFPDAKLGTISKAPIELIDGKAYQFDYDGKAYQGIYDKRKTRFAKKDSHIHESYCTNIKPLTVEVK